MTNSAVGGFRDISKQGESFFAYASAILITSSLATDFGGRENPVDVKSSAANKTEVDLA